MEEQKYCSVPLCTSLLKNPTKTDASLSLTCEHNPNLAHATIPLTTLQLFHLVPLLQQGARGASGTFLNTSGTRERAFNLGAQTVLSYWHCCDSVQTYTVYDLNREGSFFNKAPDTEQPQGIQTVPCHCPVGRYREVPL